MNASNTISDLIPSGSIPSSPTNSNSSNASSSSALSSNQSSINSPTITPGGGILADFMNNTTDIMETIQLQTDGQLESTINNLMGTSLLDLNQLNLNNNQNNNNNNNTQGISINANNNIFNTNFYHWQ